LRQGQEAGHEYKEKEIHMSKNLRIIVFLLGCFLPSWAWAEKQGNAQKEGCTKDTDCKGSRICEDGKCVEPSTAPTEKTEEDCSKDTDCKGTRICENGKCVEGGTEPAAADKKVGGSASVGKGEMVGGKGTLDSMAVNKVIKSRLTAIKMCYEKALQKKPTLEGKLNLRFTIGMSGSVTNAVVSSKTLADTELNSCLINKVKTFIFPKPEGGSVVYLFHFVFKPTDGKKPSETSVTIKGSASAGTCQKVGGKGIITPAEVNKTVKSRLTALKMCYEKALKDNPSLKGKIILRFAIGKNGRVTSSSIASDYIKDPGVSSCLIEKVKTFAFTKPDGGEVELTFPIVFQPSG
jgi:hypothetical protein